MTKEMDAIRSRIQSRRKKMGYSYQDMAKLTGISKSTLQRYETGSIGNLPIDKIEVIAHALQCTPAYLMGWELSQEYESATEHIAAAASALGFIFQVDGKDSASPCFIECEKEKKCYRISAKAHIRILQETAAFLKFKIQETISAEGEYFDWWGKTEGK